MRTVIIALVIALVVIFLGGTLRVGGNSVFGHIDSVVGVPVFTGIYRTVFFFIHRGVSAVESEISRTGEDVRQFQEKPIRIDKQKKYKQIDDAAKH